jgi:hypothetical protein
MKTQFMPSGRLQNRPLGVGNIKNKGNIMKTVEFILPTFWASYLINNDPSGMTTGEVEDCDEWMENHELSAPVDIEDYGFMREHNASSMVLPCDCSVFTFIVPYEVTP